MDLRKLREERGLTQQELADKTGIGRESIVRYENGARTPTLQALTALAEFYRVSIDTIIGRNTNPDDEIKFALFGGDAEEISDEQLEEVKRYAQYLKERKKNGAKRPT